MIVGLSVVAAIICTCVLLVRLAPQLRVLYLQHQSMVFTMPSDELVVAQGAASIPLLNQPGYLTDPRPQDNGPFAVRLNQVPTNPTGPLPVVLVHRLRAAGCQDRLVQVLCSNSQAPHGFVLWAQDYRPASLEVGSWLTPCQRLGIAGLYYFPNNRSLRVFAAQTDAEDASHFTIHYDIDGKSDIIDGWLMPDDSVKFQARSGAASQ